MSRTTDPPAPARIPEATVARLPVYLRGLAALSEAGLATVSSDILAAAAGVTGAQVRKDLNQLGSYGTRGVGYEVDHLIREINRELGLTAPRSVVLVGVGNLGRALAGYAGFAAKGFRMVALLDRDPTTFGELVGGLAIRPVADLPAVVAEHRVSIGIIATPAAAAQQVCDLLVRLGVSAILNFAPVLLTVAEGVDLRKVDLSVELQILSFHEQRKQRDAGPPGLAAGQPGAVGQPGGSQLVAQR